MKKILQKLTAFLLLLMCFAQQASFPVLADPVTEAAEAPAEAEAASEEPVTWPRLNASIEAGSAIVMDADTCQILWGREIHAKRYPASITKLLTALVVLDHCSLDEEVTFHASAVNNLESGAVTIGTVDGDVLPVRDCLYALLLKSANEVANALAEHVAGSQEAFAVMMNEKAVSLGCTDSDFHNPSGLTNKEHVTSAHDMALIGCACMNSPEFMALESEPTRKLSGTIKYPDGLTVTIGHKMRVPGESLYDPRVIAGKTGYTSASGNTLVTMAEDHGRRVVTVVLKDKNPAHYTDTKTLIDFGLEQFELMRPDPAELLESREIEKALVGRGLIQPADEVTGAYNEIRFSEPPMLTVPAGAKPEDVRVAYETVLGDGAPEGAVARASLVCSDSFGPSFYVISTRIEVESENEEVLLEGGSPDRKDGNGRNGESGSNGLHLLGWILAALLVTALLFVSYLFIRKRAEERRREERRRIRRERLERLENGRPETAGQRERSRRASRTAGRPAGRRVPGSRTAAAGDRPEAGETGRQTEGNAVKRQQTQVDTEDL